VNQHSQPPTSDIASGATPGITPDTTPDTRYKNPGYLMNRASRLLMRRAERRLVKFGLAYAQVPVMVTLKYSEAGLCQKDLAALMQIEQPAMAELLARMARDGLILREPDPKDRRSSLITLTEQARQLLPQARQTLRQGSSEALADFSEAEAEQFIGLLQRVVANLENSAALD